jgi:uncharacterized protein YdaU (DUF1376 family)
MANPQSTKFAAFQFYPRDFLTSSKVVRMSPTEVGIYFTLLCYSWLDEGLPVAPEELAKLTRIPLKRFQKLWGGVLSECFVVRSGRLVNPRMERQRKELRAYVESCRRGGENSAATRRARNGTAQPSKVPRSDLRSEPQSEPRSESQVTPNTAFASSSSSAFASASSSSKNDQAKDKAVASPRRTIADDRGTPEENLEVITAIVGKELIPLGIVADELVEATKSACAVRRIAYDSQTVRKAVESAVARQRKAGV